MKNIALDKAIEIHKKLINATGGLHGVKNIDLLESALNKPFATFYGEDLYKTIEEKIATLTYSIVNNHPMNDGNKRLGVALMGVLCKLNKIELKYTQKELIDLGLGVASGELKDKDIIQWIIEHKTTK